MDAVSYLALGRVFTANMTGNTVLLGLSLVQRDLDGAGRSALALGGFLVGGAIGAWIAYLGPREEGWPRGVTIALIIECVFLAALANDRSELLGLRVVFASIAMGIQSAAVRRLNVPGIATTYVTGTLTTAVTSLVAGSRAARPAAVEGSGRVEGVPATAHWWLGVRLQLFALLIYGFGATIGGLVYDRWPALVAVLPFVAVTVVVAGAARARTRG